MKRKLRVSHKTVHSTLAAMVVMAVSFSLKLFLSFHLSYARTLVNAAAAAVTTQIIIRASPPAHRYQWFVLCAYFLFYFFFCPTSASAWNRIALLWLNCRFEQKTLVHHLMWSINISYRISSSHWIMNMFSLRRINFMKLYSARIFSRATDSMEKFLTGLKPQRKIQPHGHQQQ